MSVNVILHLSCMMVMILVLQCPCHPRERDGDRAGSTYPCYAQAAAANNSNPQMQEESCQEA